MSETPKLWVGEPMTGRAIRRIVLEQSKRAHVGHIGSSLSIADLMASLFGDVLRVSAPNDPDRDRFVLSKGHAALALYAALHLRGWLSREELDTFCGEGTLLAVHPECALPGVDFSTGSLGHGLSMGVGAALAARLQGSGRRVYVMLSDAECNEGSVWEAAMFAAQHMLSNLVAVIDLNGQQALGASRGILDLSPMADRWRAFRWDVQEVDGHDRDTVTRTLHNFSADATSQPHVVVAHTVFGKGVSFMERQLKWHYWPMSDDEYRTAIRETVS
jgi:transketolase